MDNSFNWIRVWGRTCVSNAYFCEMVGTKSSEEMNVKDNKILFGHWLYL